MLIPYSTQIPYNAAFDAAVTKYAKAVGFKVIEYPTAGLPDQWSRGIQLAISKKVAAIDLTAGLDVRGVIPQIQRAKAAGIAVLSSTWADASYGPNPTYMSAGVPLGYRQAGELEANYAIWKTNGKGNFLEINTPGLIPSVSVGGGQHDAIKRNCPECKLRTIDVPIPQWATNTTPQVLAALKKDTGINYILPHYDSQSTFVIPALNTLGKAGKIGIASFNGTPAILELVRAGKVNMDVAEDVAWAGAATVDSILRVLGKVPPNTGTIDEHIPLRVFDSSNVKELGGKIDYGSGFGGAHDDYLKLWGVK
jgi:ribose transport system substrate-binding protein